MIILYVVVSITGIHVRINIHTVITSIDIFFLFFDNLGQQQARIHLTSKITRTAAAATATTTAAAFAFAFAFAISILVVMVTLAFTVIRCIIFGIIKLDISISVGIGVVYVAVAAGICVLVGAFLFLCFDVRSWRRTWSTKRRYQWSWHR